MAIGTTTSGQILYVDENAAPSSLEEQIKDTKDLEISYRTLHTIGEIHDINTNRIIKIPFASFFVKYKDFLESIIIQKTLTDVQQRDYLYKPKTLSNDVYGTVELWFELLRINKWASICDFKPGKTINIYDPNKLKDMINEILILEKII